MKSLSMISRQYLTQNLSASTYNNKVFLNETDRDIKMGELRLRYVKLMRDFHTSNSDEDATDLIKGSMKIWENLSMHKKI